MNDVRFSVLIYLKSPEPDHYKEMLLSLSELQYTNYEVYLISGMNTHIYQAVAEEIFPKDGRIHFKEIDSGTNAARAYNAGMRFVTGDYVIFLGQEDTIAADYMLEMEKAIVGSLLGEAGELSVDDLTRAASANILRRWKETAPDLLYSDHDELVSGIRMNPHFKGEFNRELLLQSDYIGCSFCVSLELLRRVGFFNERLTACEFYDYMLRVEGLLRRGEVVRIKRIPLLLYHLRIRELPENVYRKVLRERYDTYYEIALNHQEKHHIPGIYYRDNKSRFWKLENRKKEYLSHRKEYILLRDPDVQVRSARVMPRLYARISEPDVAVVALRILNKDGKIDNCGFIYDENGISYPACANQKWNGESYGYRNLLSQEISCADASCCLIDATVYKKLRGFRKDLAERDRMLDFCMRARAAGYRIIYEPDAIAKRKKSAPESSELSNKEMLRMYGPNGENSKIRFGEGDPFYNPNLPMGVENYIL